jgi:hypothetical protein
MIMEKQGIGSLDAGASNITYEGNEGPKSPAEEMKMAGMMSDIAADFEIEHGYDMAVANPEMREAFIREWLKNNFYNKTDIPFNKGGRVGYALGTGPVLPSDEDPINPFAPKPTGPALPDKMMAGGGERGWKAQMRAMEIAEEEYGKDFYDLNDALQHKIYNRALQEIDDMFFDMSRKDTPQDIQMAARGGRIGQMIGTGPNGLPGIPRMAPDGMEFDMRQNGGFQPLGAKEKKDDVPAMLAKNEFVFTADAVRGAGNGDIELGAQKMYDTMKNLERRVT